MCLSSCLRACLAALKNSGISDKLPKAPGLVESGLKSPDRVTSILSPVGLCSKTATGSLPFAAWNWKNNGNLYAETGYLLECEDVSKITLNPKEHSEYKWLAKGEYIPASEEMHTSIAKAFEVHRQPRVTQRF